MIFLTWFFLISLHCFAQKEYYFSCTIEKKEDLEQITRLISIDQVKNQKVYAYANQEQLDRFQKSTSYDLVFLDRPSLKSKSVSMAYSISEMVNWDKYPTYEVYVDMMNQFAADYPEISHLQSIGLSEEGREILVLKISDNVETEEREPEFFYTSTIHGDETAGFVFMLRFIDSLLSGYGNKQEITDYIDGTEIYVNPNSNPDGTYNGGNSTIAQATRFNANAVDLNRNFPDPEDGNHPDGYDWQSETRTMMDFASSHNFILSANFHGGAEVVNYPWDTWAKRHVDDTWFQQISHRFADTVMNNSPAGYFTGISNDGITNGYDWYSISGGRQDYMTYFHHARELTLEISEQKILSSDELRMYWNYLCKSMFQYLGEIQKGIHGVVTDDEGNPLKAKISIENRNTEQDQSAVYSDSVHGDYHRLIEAGTYEVTFSAYGFQSETIGGVVVPPDDSVHVNTSLAQKQVYAIEGMISDSQTGQPIEQAVVSILNHPIADVVTDSTGSFTLSAVEPGELVLRIWKEGYAMRQIDTLVDSLHTRFDFQLKEADVESFETGDLLNFDWENSGNLPWEITGQQSKVGDYSLVSGRIGDNEQSVISVNVDLLEEGRVSFFKKVSSEQGFDFLDFYIDGELQNSWSGFVDWSMESYVLPAGSHSLTWRYSKDMYTSSGDDRAWIDFVSFPPVEPASIRFSSDTLHLFLEDKLTQTDTVSLFNQGSKGILYDVYVEDAADHPWIQLDSQGKIGANDTQPVMMHFSVEAIDSTYSCRVHAVSPDSATHASVEVIVEVAAPTGIWFKNRPVHPAQSFEVIAYPNPFKDHITLRLFLLNPQKSIQVSVYNLKSQVMLSKKLGNLPGGMKEIHLKMNTENMLKENMFFIQVSNGREIITKSVIRDIR